VSVITEFDGPIFTFRDAARVKAVVASFIQPNAEWTCWKTVAAMALKTANSRLSRPRMTHRIAATVAARDQGVDVAKHRCRWLSEKVGRFATPGAFRPGPLTRPAIDEVSDHSRALTRAPAGSQRWRW